MASSAGRHEADHISIELASGDIAGADINIPIGYEPQIKRNKKASSLRTMENVKVERKEKLTNKKILYSAKRGYSVLLIITVLLLIVLTIYVMAGNNKLRYYLFKGITACILSLLLMIPIFILYRFLEKKIILQFDTINNKIIETFSLKQQLQHKNEQNLQQEQYINNLKLIIAEQEKKINKINNKNTIENTHKLHLINGFRKGQMEIQIEFAEIDQLVAMLNVVVSCITLLPFGQTNYRKKLKYILQQKIEKNKYLQMHFYFFLLSYVECTDVKRLFRKHKIMKKVKSLADHYQYNDDNFDDGMTINSDTGTAYSASAPFSPYTDASPTNQYNFNGGFPDHQKTLNPPINPPINPQSIICFKEKDPIKLFRAPIDHKTKPGARIMVPLDLQNRFFDPINGNKFLQQLVVRDIFNSNAKPYLIDCFVKKTTSNHSNDDDIKDIDDDDTDNGMKLSSSFILKQGDDLRKDQAILQMFSFMNDIWRE